MSAKRGKHMSKENYWEKKDGELKELLKKCDIEMETYNRKAAVEALQLHDLKSGKGKEVIVEGVEGEVEKLDPNKDLVKVRFHNMLPTDPPYIFVGHNGRSYYIPKEEDIWVPRFLLDSVIKDAIEIHSDMQKRPDGKIIHIPKKIQRFPYTVVND
jgi:hypothetical protein